MKSSRRKPEPTIALINIVFLMLIFFLVAGTLAPPLDGELKLVSTADLDHAPPQGALVVHSDGRLSFRGEDVENAVQFMEMRDEDTSELRIVPDRELSAHDLVELGQQLRDAGARQILIVTERGLE